MNQLDARIEAELDELMMALAQWRFTLQTPAGTTDECIKNVIRLRAAFKAFRNGEKA